MSRNNGEPQTVPQLNSRAQRELEIPMASFQERLEAIRSESERGNTGQEGETYPLVVEDLTNLLLLELVKKQNEQIECQSEHLQRMIEAREKGPMEDNSYMFKKFANHNPPKYDGAPNL